LTKTQRSVNSRVSEDTQLDRLFQTGPIGRNQIPKIAQHIIIGSLGHFSSILVAFCARDKRASIVRHNKQRDTLTITCHC